MKTNTEKKTNILKEITLLAKNSISTIIINYSNIKSLELKYFRKSLFDNKIKAKVLKNTLAKKAFQKTINEKLSKDITGQTLAIFSDNDITSPIKIVNEFRNKYNEIKIKSICIHGTLFSEKNINELINLPNKKNAIIKLNTYIKLPILNMINYLKQPNNKLHSLIKTISHK